MRTSIISITLLSLFLLSVSSTDRIPFARTPNPSGIGSTFLVQASHLRNVPINSTKEFGFYVNVDLANSAESKETPSYASMVVALYSSVTLLASECKKFYKYDCEKFQCKDSQDLIISHYPYFIAEGHSITANMILEKASWVLGSNAVYATKCTGNTAADFGVGSYGLIGMGVKNLAAKNYIKKDIQFSIFLKQDRAKGELIFSKDFSKALNETAVAVFPADDHWNVQGKISITIGNGFSMQNPKERVIFDLHADVTGFPKNDFSNLMATWPQRVKNGTVECLHDEHYFYRPVCTYKAGEEPVFPTLSVSYGEGKDEQTIVITQDMYLEYLKGETPSVRLNIRALGSMMEKSENYVTPSFDDTIILDSSILSAYYTVFEAGAEGKNSISFYPANHKAENNSNSLVAYIILGVFVVLLLFFAFLTYSSYLKKQKARDGLFTNSSLFDQHKKGDYSLASSTT